MKYGDNLDIKEQEKVDKAWSFDQLKEKVKEFIINGQKQFDYTELDAFYFKVLSDIIQPCIVPFSGEDRSINQDTSATQFDSGTQDPKGNGVTQSEPPAGFTPPPPEDDLPF